MALKVSNHEDDDHQCAAATHACGEVTITFQFPQCCMLCFTSPALRSLLCDVSERIRVYMQREVQNFSVSVVIATVKVI